MPMTRSGKITSISFLDHREHSPEAVRLVLNDVERDSIIKHGYGLHSFTHSLVETFEKLSVDPVTPELHERILSFSQQIADHPIEILPGVPEALQYLSERHHLILMTRGTPAEKGKKTALKKKIFFPGWRWGRKRTNRLIDRRSQSMVSPP